MRAAWARRRASSLDVEAVFRAIPEVDDATSALVPVNSIVFSKDRAMQLDACLRSIARFSPNEGPVIVIYKATTPEFARGYELLNPGDRVRLVAESDDFRRDVMEAIDPEARYTVFHTDDDVFFRRPPAIPIVPEGFAALSLRLGENTNFCYPTGQTQAIPELVATGPWLAWNWVQASGDFAYPMSLDGHVFRTSLIVRMLSRLRFTNPNRLEESLMRRRFSAPPLMLSFRESCVVSLPVNVVTTTHANRAGADPGLSPEALNARFLSGERIDLEAMDFSDVRGAHQEIALEFKTVA